MKIRTDFVTNSSSTSFIIITKGKLNEKDLFELIGVRDESPLAPVFQSLYKLLVEKMSLISEEKGYWEYAEGKELADLLKADFSEQMTKKIIEAKEKRKNVYIGKLSSEENAVESFLCCESFELDNEKIYFNGLECAW